MPIMTSSDYGEDLTERLSCALVRAEAAEAELILLRRERDALKAALAILETRENRREAVETDAAVKTREQRLRCALFLRCLELPGVTSPEDAWAEADAALKSIEDRGLTTAMAAALLRETT